LQKKKVDGKQLRKRPRVEKVKKKAINHVAQLQEQHNGLTGLINSIVSMTSEGPRPAAAEPVNPGVIATKNSLTALATPPGLPAVCQKLAEGLAGYGFCTLQELLTCGTPPETRITTLRLPFWQDSIGLPCRSAWPGGLDYSLRHRCSSSS
jgi:hypothetical protein